MRGELGFWQGMSFTGWEPPQCAEEGCEKPGERILFWGEYNTGLWFCEEHLPHTGSSFDVLLEEAE